MDLNKLSPRARKAAMRGGTDGWGEWGSASQHVRYVEAAPPSSRRRCHCGCKGPAKFLGMANGLCLTEGCELSVERWAREGTRTP
jgi:hypothetical protein